MAMAQQHDDDTTARERRFPMSYDDFLVWADEDVHAEWADGEVTVFMPPNIRHQFIANFLQTVLTLFARASDRGDVLSAPLEMRARPGGPAREPDILFVAAAHRDRLTAQRLVGPADFVVEIVSEESANRDRTEKFYEYEEAGIGEYLIIDPRPRRERVDFYRLTEAKKYLAVLPDGAGRYHSAVLPGFWFDPAWFWATPTPDPLLTLAEIAPDALAPVLAALAARGHGE
jgi:Uma2 family endonuclease